MHLHEHLPVPEADGDLLLAGWHLVPLEMLTVDGDAAQAAAMMALVDLD